MSDKGVAVLVTTEFRGVFFGYLALPIEEPKTTVTLQQARNCVYWSNDVRGFLGLATKGPSASCRIGPAVSEIMLHKVTAVASVSDEATRAWESSPWT